MVPTGARREALSSTTTSAIRFTFLSVASGVTNLGLTAALHELVGLSEELSYAIALVCALIQNFLGMRYFVYGASSQPWATQFLQFAGATAGFRGLEYLSFLVVHNVMGVHYLIAVAANMVVFTIAKFLFYRVAIFSR